MIKNVAREYKWSPKILGDLFIDSQDYEGLEFWNDDVLAIKKELTKPK